MESLYLWCNFTAVTSHTRPSTIFFPIRKTKFWWTSLKCFHDNSRVHFVSVSQPCSLVRRIINRSIIAKNTSQSARRICYGRVVQWIMVQWISGSIGECMYVTPIRLDLLLNTNQISCYKGKWYVRIFDPDTVENGHIYSSVKEEEVFIYWVYLDIFCGLG